MKTQGAEVTNAEKKPADVANQAKPKETRTENPIASEPEKRKLEQKMDSSEKNQKLEDDQTTIDTYSESSEIPPEKKSKTERNYPENETKTDNF